MRISLLTIGDEILIGQIVDTNSSWMARQLNAIGAEVVSISTAGDDTESLRSSLDTALSKADAVLMTGGLGPTRDDKTKEVLADLMGDDLVFHEETYARILKLFERLGREPTEAHRKQAYMPASATILKNKMGTAPGMWFSRKEKVIVSMPGVPYEMKYLMEQEVLPRLQKQFPGRPLLHRTLLTVGEGESRIAKRIEHFEDSLPSNIKLAYLPGLGQVRLRLSANGDSEDALRSVLDAKMEELIEEVPELVFGFDEDSLESVIGAMLIERGLSLATAESCTGGYIAHRVTSVAGSSAYFVGSVVAYSNEIKMKLLGVSEITLQNKGAVSKETVVQMANGAIKTLGADIAVSISGIAGPGGGSDEKPVGTIWLAVSDGKNTATLLIHTTKGRQLNIEYSTVAALNLARTFMLEHYPLKQAERPR